jgi:hypothetical protein
MRPKPDRSRKTATDLVLPWHILLVHELGSHCRGEKAGPASTPNGKVRANLNEVGEPPYSICPSDISSEGGTSLLPLREGMTSYVDPPISFGQDSRVTFERRNLGLKGALMVWPQGCRSPPVLRNLRASGFDSQSCPKGLPRRRHSGGSDGLGFQRDEHGLDRRRTTRVGQRWSPGGKGHMTAR